MLTPTKFPEANVTYAEHQPEYLPLPAFRSPGGEVVTCWKAPLADRIRFLFTGRLWINMLTFGTPLQPIVPFFHHPFPKPKPTADDLEAQRRYDIAHKTIGSDDDF